MIYNNGIEDKDMWEEASRFFVKEKNKTENMNLKKFYTGDKFGLVIDMRCMASQAMHGSGTRLVNSTDGVQLEIERSTKGSGVVILSCIRHLRLPVQHFGQTVSILYSINMDPSKIPFNALIVGPTNSGKSRFVVDQLYGPFRFQVRLHRAHLPDIRAQQDLPPNW